MRRIQVLIIATILIISCTQMTFAVINTYSINDGKASITINEDKWDVYSRENINSLKNTLDNDTFSMISSQFDSSEKVELVAIADNGNFLWNVGIEDGTKLKSLEEFSESDIRSLNMSDLTDEEIMDSKMGEGIVNNLRSTFDEIQIEFEDVRDIGKYKYYILGCNATLDGTTVGEVEYMTIVKKSICK